MSAAVAGGQRVALVIRPEHVRLAVAGDGWRGTVVAGAFLGETVDHVVDVGPVTLRARTSPAESLPPGTAVSLALPAESCLVIPDETR
jgi:hypothetical protein